MARTGNYKTNGRCQYVFGRVRAEPLGNGVGFGRFGVVFRELPRRAVRANPVGAAVTEPCDIDKSVARDRRDNGGRGIVARTGESRYRRGGLGHGGHQSGAPRILSGFDRLHERPERRFGGGFGCLVRIPRTRYAVAHNDNVSVFRHGIHRDKILVAMMPQSSIAQARESRRNGQLETVALRCHAPEAAGGAVAVGVDLFRRGAAFGAIGRSAGRNFQTRAAFFAEAIFGGSVHAALRAQADQKNVPGLTRFASSTSLIFAGPSVSRARARYDSSSPSRRSSSRRGRPRMRIAGFGASARESTRSSAVP